MSRSIRILQVDAFSTRPLGGNPAGVVLDADSLSDGDMQRVAREMNCAETAFVSRETAAGADLRLRWFTPTGHEIAFCGHATVATVHALAEARRLSGDRIVFDTRGGLLPVRVERSEGRAQVWLEPRLATCAAYPGALPEVIAALGTAALGGWARPALTSDRDLLLPLSGLAALRRLQPDVGAIGRLATAENLRGICCVALEGIDPGSLTHCRFFAPHVGIPEDPVTGSVHAAMALWLWEARALAAEGGIARFTAEQGDLLGRPGRLDVELHLERGQPGRVRVGGGAVTVLSGALRLD